jgi:hypothetical protein
VEDYEAVEKVYFNVLIKSVKVRGREVLADDNKVAYDPRVPRLTSLYGAWNLYWLLEKCVDPEYGDVTDPKEGAWFRFRRKEDGGKWEREILPYQKKHYDDPFGRAIGGNDEEVQQILSKMIDMEKVWTTPSDDYIKKARKAAAALEDLFEQKLKMEDQKEAELSANAKIADEAEPLTKAKAEKVVETVSKAEMKAAAKAAPPHGAPECYGDSETIYGGFPTEEAAEEADLSPLQAKQLRKCQGCAYEMDCARAAKS